MSIDLFAARATRAKTIALAAGEGVAARMESALASGTLEAVVDISVSEALIMGLLKQGVRKFIGVFGHGSTELGEVLRAYASEGLVEVFNVRSEIEASHAAAALRRTYGETAAVFTSIGPGALQAMSASLVGFSDGIGVWYLFGDETTHDEGYNMQQIPRREQGLFLRLISAMGPAYSLHTGWALPEALRRGTGAVNNPQGEKPYFLLLPMNVQAQIMKKFNLRELPRVPRRTASISLDETAYSQAVAMIAQARRIVVKVGNGAAGLADCVEFDEFLRRADAVYVHGPQAVGFLPGKHPRNMTVGGSKGSIAGNAAMKEADLAIVIGARAVCQWDSSGTAWKSAQAFISINTNFEDAYHYNDTLAFTGDAVEVIRRLVLALRAEGMDKGRQSTAWYRRCRGRRRKWDQFLASRIAVPAIDDPKFGGPALSQPAAIAATAAFCEEKGAVKYFDAGDVQANGFQIVEDEKPGDTFTETGASYMGFAASAILASAIADHPRYPVAFTGDGSFMMNPQILIDAVAFRLRGMVVIFDNRRMAAISSLQTAQYSADFRTDDHVAVDYAAMADAVKGVRGFRVGSTVESLKEVLEKAYAFEGLAVVHVPVYSGLDARGGLGTYGSWNVGNWCEAVQKEKHRQGH